MPSGDEFVTLKEEKITIKEVIIFHIKKISDLATKEFTPSYWSKKPTKIGDGIALVETYHSDSRMAYCNAVDFLYDLIIPHADKQFLETVKILNEQEDEKEKRFIKEGKTREDWAWIKLGLRRKLFRQMILLIDREKIFSPTLSMSDEEIGQMLEEEEEKERERVEWEEANL